MTILGLNPSRLFIGGNDDKYRLNDTPAANTNATPKINVIFTVFKNLFSFLTTHLKAESLSEFDLFILNILIYYSFSLLT